MSELTSSEFRWREKAFFQKGSLASALAEGKEGIAKDKYIVYGRLYS